MQYQGKSNQQGSVTIFFGIAMIAILMMSVIAITLGREVVARRELQSAADSLALAGAYSLEQVGTQPQMAMSRLVAKNNVAFPFTAKFLSVKRRLTEHRTVVSVELSSKFDSRQGLLTPRYLDIKVRAHAQVNEMVFSEIWPALTIVLDASESMKYPILGSSGIPAFKVMTDVLTEYFSNTLPVRNGLVIFNDMVLMPDVPPPNDNDNNHGALQAALVTAAPNGRTNTRAALDRAATQQRPLIGGHNVLLISDGEPTLGGACAPNAPCHFNAAVAASDRVRGAAPGADAFLFTVEIRRTNYSTDATNFLVRAAGQNRTGGNNTAMHFVTQSAIGIRAFMLGLASSICMFGPLDPGPGEPPDVNRFRPVNSNLAGPPQRVFAFLREPSGHEMRLPMVPDRMTSALSDGFEYVLDATGAYVILTLRSCNRLGANPGRRLVVRWDDAQLVGPPPP